MSSKKKKFGDRKDARLCKDVNGMNQICIDLKPKRSLSEVYINEKFDVTTLVNYINEKNDNNDKITYFHAFVTAIGKTIYNRPLLNRFVANRHVYEHNDITLSFVMKIEFNDKSEEVMVLVPIEEKDNIFSISKKISNKVNNVREKKDRGTGANDAILVISKLPNILRIPLVALFKYLDKIGCLPASLVKDNLYYSSMLLSNIGTLKCDGIYHNITDFGTCSGIITIGEIKEEIVKTNNKNEKRYYCEFGITLDERIADGFYFIKSLKLLQHIFNNPKMMEEWANEKIEF